MQLKVHDTEDFNIALALNISYELKYIELTVCVCNKKAHTTKTKTFAAQNFAEALDYFEQQERFLLGTNGG